MSVKIGDIYFNSVVSSFTNVDTIVGDVLVGKEHIYVVHGHLSTVTQYRKNSDGTFGERLRLSNWYSNDSTTHQISRNGSSVPSAYTLYIENDKEYLVGWSMDYSSIYTWEINSANNTIISRSAYPSGRTMTTYSRAGWDGDRYIYFFHRGESKIYRWDLRSKFSTPTPIVTIPNYYSLDSSYTGSGLYILNGKAYWGDGSNESNGLLGAFNLSNGTLSSLMRSTEMAQVPGALINGNAGTVQISPLHPNRAYYFYASSNLIRVLSINSSVDIESVSINSPIHTENAVLTSKIAKVSNATDEAFTYRVLVNGTQVYPTSGWSTQMRPPYEINTSIDHSHFKVGANTVRIEVQDSFNGIIYKDVTLTKSNTPPTGIVGLSSNILHKDNLTLDVTLNDAERDYVQYRVTVNGVQKYPASGFTPLVESPVDDIRVVLLNEYFNLGANTVNLYIRDSLGSITTNAYTVIKRNTAPKVSIGRVEGGLLIATIMDDDGDKVKYRVLLNGSQIFPQEGFTNFIEVPFDVKVRFPQERINVAQQNKATIEFEDDMGIQTTWEYTFEGDYSGLMFCDAAEEYYSTDIGEILKYLDFGTIVAGQTTIAERVFIKNTLGYPVENLSLNLNQGDLEPPHSRVEMSQFDSPFVSQPILIYPDGLRDQEKLSFYVRIVTDREAKWGGMFEISVKADPLKPVFNTKKDLTSRLNVR